MKNMKNKILALLSLLFLFLASTSFVHAHFLGYSSVDAGEIRWGGSTQYSSAWSGGISTWNALGLVNIAPDTIWTYEDLTVSDVNRSDVSWVGQYTYYSWTTDTIQLNAYYLNNDTSAERQNTTTHELGHSLGLAHSFSGNVMYAYQTSQTSLGSHDISDYNELY